MFRVGRAGEYGEICPLAPPLGDEGRGDVARILVRVGACPSELRLVGVECEMVRSGLAIACGGWGSVARNSSRAWAPPSMEGMGDGPCGEGAHCTIQFVVRGGLLRARRGFRLGRFAVTNGCKMCEGTLSSRVVIDMISNPNR